MARSMLDMSLSEILAAGRAGRGGGGAGEVGTAAAGGGRGRGGGGGGINSRRGEAFASRFPRRLPISKRGGSGPSFSFEKSSSSYNGARFAADRWTRGGRRPPTSFFGGWRGGGGSRWRGSSAVGTESFFVSEELEETGETGWGGRPQGWERRRVGGDAAFADAAAAAARTAADAAAEAAAEAAGEVTMAGEEDWENRQDDRRGRAAGGRRRWGADRAARDVWATDEWKSDVPWESDRFFAPPPASQSSSSSSFFRPPGGGSDRRRGGGVWRGARTNSSNASRTIVRISNLDYTVLEEDLKELFGAVGEVVKVWIDYDRTDRSKGTGGCIFRFLADAERAIRVYEGKKIEGLPLHLELQAPGGGAGASAAPADFFSYRPAYAGYNSSYVRGGAYGGTRRGWRG